MDERVGIQPHPPRNGELVKVTYNGLLVQSGAEQVFLHMGYGNPWSGITDLPMQRAPEGWQRIFPVQYGTKLNFCFKDGAGSWDNNNGQNWSVDINQHELD
ncbi:MAG: carbohydrate-binding protein [Clostridia bacterium]|nr:carbohydrate-binding protein [Clostridia bacterium]